MELTPLIIDPYAGKLKNKFQGAGIKVSKVSRHNKGFTVEVDPETVNKENRKKIETNISKTYGMLCLRSIINRNTFHVRKPEDYSDSE